MKNVYYPLAGMNYVIDDLSQIIENKVEGKKEIILWLSAQVNCFPHIGTLVNFMSAFTLAKHFSESFNLPVKIKVELLESVTGEEVVIDGHKYYKNLENVKVGEKTIKETYLPYFEEILKKLVERTGVNYEILFFYDYQKDRLVKESLLEVIENSEKLSYVLDPKGGEIRLRFPCPSCGLTEKHIKYAKYSLESAQTLSAYAFCPIHGKFEARIAENSTDKFDMNVPLRYLVKALYLTKSDELNETVSVIVDGGDWSGMWPLRVYMEPLLKMGKRDVPNIIYTPTILDWSGSKLSKRMYVGNEAYREYLKEGLINYSKFYEQYGDDAFDIMYNEITSWVKSPKKFIRDYTIEYIDAILTGEKINII